MLYRESLGLAAIAVIMMAASTTTVPAADLAAGKKVFRKCQGCHVLDRPSNRAGPHLNNVFGRTAGSVKAFKYSKAMKKAGADGLVWNDETMAAYLKKPRAFIKGGRMAFSGLKKDADIANVLSHIKQESQ